MGRPDNEVRAWALEAVQSGATPEQLAQGLRSRWGLPMIPAIKLLREVTGLSLGDAKTMIDQTLPADYVAARESAIATSSTAGWRIWLCQVQK